MTHGEPRDGDPRPTRDPKDSDPRPVVLITGVSGLIGSRVAVDLSRDHRVIGLDVKRPTDGAGSAEFYECDLTEDRSVTRALEHVRESAGHRIASVLHFAAYYDFAGESSPLYRELNVVGTRRLVEALRPFEVQQIVYSSSLLVMEPVADEESQERLTEASPLSGEWPYPQSKIDAETVLRRTHGSIPIVILRIAGVYDRDCHSIPLAQHIARIDQRKIESFFFPGDADHGQPFIHADDVVRCVRRVIERRQDLGPEETFLIAEPEVESHRDLQQHIGKLLHGTGWPTVRIPKVLAKVGAWARARMSSSEETFIKPWMIDLADDHYPVEINRARRRLGWEPEHRLESELPEMVERLRGDPRSWYLEQGLEPPDGGGAPRQSAR